MPDHDAYPGIPRWVKIGALVLLGLLVLAVALMLLMPGQHGPMRHTP